VGAFIHPHSPVLAAVSPMLCPPLAVASTEPCPGAPDGGPLRLWGPYSLPESSLGSSSSLPEPTTGWFLHWAQPWGPECGAPEAVAAPIHFQSPTLAAPTPPLAPHMADSSTGHSSGATDGGSHETVGPYLFPESSPGSRTSHLGPISGWFLHWALPWSP